MLYSGKPGEVKIISMTPANPGWYLRLKDRTGDTRWRYIPVACWALCSLADGERILPCVTGNNGTLVPNDPDMKPSDLVYLPGAIIEGDPTSGAVDCRLISGR